MDPCDEDFACKRLKPEGLLRRKRWGFTGRRPQTPTAHPATHLTADLDTDVSTTAHPDAPLSVPPPRESAKYITADEAYAHATAQEPAICEALSGLEYEGGYSLHAGFSEEMLHCGQRQEEIYVVLDREVDNAIAAALGDILAPYPGVVYMPEGAYHVHVDTPKLTSILRGEDSEERKVEREAVAKPEEGQAEGGSGGEEDEAGEHDVQAIKIPFKSTLSLKPRDAPEDPATEFRAHSCVDIIINKNRKSDSPPPGSQWPGPWISVDLSTLDISTRRSSADLRSDYTVALCLVCILSSLAPASVLRSTPFMIHVEDTVNPDTRSPGAARGALRTLAGGLTLCLGLTKTPTVTVGAERTQHSWDIYSQLLGAGAQDHSEGTAWTYLHNGSAGKELEGVAAERIELEPKPRLVLGYKMSEDHVLEVEVVVHWSLNATRSRQTLQPAFSFVPVKGKVKGTGKGKGKSEARAGIPVFLNFLHHVSVVVDLGNIKPENPSVGAGEEANPGGPQS